MCGVYEEEERVRGRLGVGDPSGPVGRFEDWTIDTLAVGCEDGLNWFLARMNECIGALLRSFSDFLNRCIASAACVRALPNRQPEKRAQAQCQSQPTPAYAPQSPTISRTHARTHLVADPKYSTAKENSHEVRSKQQTGHTSEGMS